jgi:hypothetical protein
MDYFSGLLPLLGQTGTFSPTKFRKEVNLVNGRQDNDL